MAARQRAHRPGGADGRSHGGTVAVRDRPARSKRRLLGGLDDIGVTLQHRRQIADYERDRERTGPVTTGA